MENAYKSVYKYNIQKRRSKKEILIAKNISFFMCSSSYIFFNGAGQNR